MNAAEIALAIALTIALVAIIIDDMLLRQYNTQLRQQLELLNEELAEADAQCIRYAATLAHERQGQSVKCKGKACES